MTWELRWHPFRGQWVLFTSHRDARPWIGERAAPAEPPGPRGQCAGPSRGNAICTRPIPTTGGLRLHQRPSRCSRPTGARTRSDGDDVYRTRRAGGTAEVVCYHHDPTRSLADLTDDEMAAIVVTWREPDGGPAAEDGVAHVLIFENRGAMVGTSNPHPHCQIYAGSMVYATMAREAEVASAHHRRTGRAAAGRRDRPGARRPPGRQRG
jgi:UDPglucose--hexose-1-phosphate uridylyltransferase